MKASSSRKESRGLTDFLCRNSDMSEPYVTVYEQNFCFGIQQSVDEVLRDGTRHFDRNQFSMQKNYFSSEPFVTESSKFNRIIVLQFMCLN
jgi:hypothetical protein